MISIDDDSQQIIGREGETAILYVIVHSFL
jgi:hypothetical protein